MKDKSTVNEVLKGCENLKIHEKQTYVLEWQFSVELSPFTYILQHDSQLRPPGKSV